MTMGFVEYFTCFAAVEKLWKSVKIWKKLQRV